MMRPFALAAGAGGPDGLRFGRDVFICAAVFGDGIIAKVSLGGDVVARWPVGTRNPAPLCFTPDQRALHVTEAETHSLICIPIAD